MEDASEAQKEVKTREEEWSSFGMKDEYISLSVKTGNKETQQLNLAPTAQIMKGLFGCKMNGKRVKKRK